MKALQKKPIDVSVANTMERIHGIFLDCQCWIVFPYSEAGEASTPSMVNLFPHLLLAPCIKIYDGHLVVFYVLIVSQKP